MHAQYACVKLCLHRVACTFAVLHFGPRVAHHAHVSLLALEQQNTQHLCSSGTHPFTCCLHCACLRLCAQEEESKLLHVTGLQPPTFQTTGPILPQAPAASPTFPHALTQQLHQQFMQQLPMALADVTVHGTLHGIWFLSRCRPAPQTHGWLTSCMGPMVAQYSAVLPAQALADWVCVMASYRMQPVQAHMQPIWAALRLQWRSMQPGCVAMLLWGGARVGVLQQTALVPGTPQHTHPAEAQGGQHIPQPARFIPSVQAAAAARRVLLKEAMQLTPTELARLLWAVAYTGIGHGVFRPAVCMAGSGLSSTGSQQQPRKGRAGAKISNVAKLGNKEDVPAGRVPRGPAVQQLLVALEHKLPTMLVEDFAATLWALHRLQAGPALTAAGMLPVLQTALSLQSTYAVQAVEAHGPVHALPQLQYLMRTATLAQSLRALRQPAVVQQLLHALEALLARQYRQAAVAAGREAVAAVALRQDLLSLLGALAADADALPEAAARDARVQRAMLSVLRVTLVQVGWKHQHFACTAVHKRAACASSLPSMVRGACFAALCLTAHAACCC